MLLESRSHQHGPIRVVCGVRGGSADEAAVLEACSLAGRGGHVALVCVVAPEGGAPDPRAHATLASAIDALERAMWQTHSAGVRSSVYVLRHSDPARALRAAADGGALVVAQGP